MAIVLKTISDSKQAQQDLTKLRESVDNIKTSTERVSNSFLSLGKAIGAIATAGIAVKSFMSMSDQLTSLENRIKIVTKTQAEFNAVFGQVRQIAMASRSDLGSVAQLYTKLSLATKEMGANQRQISAVTEAISKSMAISGASAEEAKNSIQQLGQAFASGKLGGDEFRSVMENAPELAQAIAKGMGVTLGKMYELRDAGKLTSRDVFAAILKQQDQINAKFGKLSVTYASAFKNLGNSLLLLFGSVKDAFFGSSDGISQGINNIALGIAKFAKNFRYYLALAKVNALIFVYDVVDAFEFMWDLISKGPKAIYEAFKNWLGKVSPFLAKAIGAAEAYSVKVATAIAGTFAGIAATLKKNGFISTITTYLTSAAQTLARTINRIFNAIIKIDVGNIFPNLGKALNVVKTWAIAVERWFFWVYDQVIGHSWIPDLVEGVIAWIGKLTGAPLNIIKTFASTASKLFSGIRFAAPFALVFGILGKFHKVLFGVLGVVAAIAAAWAGLNFAGAKLDFKVFSDNTVIKYLKNISDNISKSLNKRTSEAKTKADKFLNTLPLIRDLKQAFGMKDTYEGSVRGEVINTKGEVGRGPQQNMKSRSFLHDVTNILPPKAQFAFLTILTGLVGVGIIAATESGGVRSALLAMVSLAFINGITNNMKLSSVAKGFETVFNKISPFKIDTSRFQKEADRLLKRFSKADAVAGPMRTVELIPDNMKVAFLTIITGIFGAAIVAATSAGPVRGVLLSVLTSIFGIALARMVPADQIRESFLSAGDGLIKLLAVGLTELFNGPVFKDPFGFLGLLAKTSLLFKAGREYLGKAALGAATAPTRITNTVADGLRLKTMNSSLAKFEEKIEGLQRVLGGSNANLKDSLEKLSKEFDRAGNRVGAARARAIASGADAGTDLRNQAGVAAARNAYNTQNAAEKDLSSARDNTAYNDTKKNAEALGSKLREARENVKQGVRDFSAGAGGAVGAASGLQIGAAISAGMAADTPAWQKVGVEIASAMAGQAIGAGIGQVAAAAFLGTAMIVAKGVGIIWTAAAARVGAIWLASSLRAALVQRATMISTYAWWFAAHIRMWAIGAASQVASAAMAAAIWVGGIVGGGALLGAAIIAGIALLIAGIGIVAYIFWDDLSDPKMWKALGISVLNIVTKIQETMINALIYAGTTVYNWLAKLIGASEAKAAEVKMYQFSGGIEDYQKQKAKNSKTDPVSQNGKPAVAAKPSGGMFDNLDAKKIWGSIKGAFSGAMPGIPKAKAAEVTPTKAPDFKMPRTGGGGFSPGDAIESVQKSVKSLGDRLASAKDEKGVLSVLAGSLGVAGFKISPDSLKKLSADTISALSDPLGQIEELRSRIAANPDSPLNATAWRTISELEAAIKAQSQAAFDLGELEAPLKRTAEAVEEDKKKKRKGESDTYTGLTAGERYSTVAEVFPELGLTEDIFNKLLPEVADGLVKLALPIRQAKDVFDKRPISDSKATQAGAQSQEARRKASVGAASGIVSNSLTPFQKVSASFEEAKINSINEQLYNIASKSQRAAIDAQVAAIKESSQKLLDPTIPDEMRRNLEFSINKSQRVLADMGKLLGAALDDAFLGPLKARLERGGVGGIDDFTLNTMSDAQRESVGQISDQLAEARERLKDPNLGEEERKALAKQVMDISENLSEQLSKLPEAQYKKVKDAGNALASSIHSGLTESLTGFLTGKGLNIKGLLDRVTSTIVGSIVNGLLDPLTGENGLFSTMFKKLGSSLYGGAKSTTEVFNKPNFDFASQMPGPIVGYGSGTFNIDGSKQTSGMLNTAIPQIPDLLQITKKNPFGGVAESLADPKAPLADGINNVLPDVGKQIAEMPKDLGKVLPKPSAGGGGGIGAFAGLGGSLFGMLIGGLFADGGLIKGPGTGRSDSILAGVSTGEFIVNAEDTKKNLPLLKAMNSGKLSNFIPKFADGGLVSTAIIAPMSMATLDAVKPSEKQSSNTTVNLKVTGDVSRQTKAEIYRMLPAIADGVNSQNREKGYRG